MPIHSDPIWQKATKISKQLIFIYFRGKRLYADSESQVNLHIRTLQSIL